MKAPALLVAMTLAACGGSPGRIANARRDVTAFVVERDTILADTAGGLVRISLDGSGLERVAPTQYHHLSSTRDGRVLALGDRDTNLFVITRAARQPRRISQLDERAGAAALSPDGTRLAVARHADFSLPQARWDATEDDAIYLVDTDTLAIDVIPATQHDLVSALRWTADGAALLLWMSSFRTVRLDLATRARNDVAREAMQDEAVSAATNGGTRCPATGDLIELAGHRGDDGIDVIAESGTTRVVQVLGRSRGFHDYQPTIGDAVFSTSCRYIVFEMQRAVWVADRTTGSVGHLIDGSLVKMLAP